MWKYHDFSVSHILRAINFGDPRSAKLDILELTQAKNVDFLINFALFKGWKFPKSTKFRAPKMAKKDIFQNF